jgi:peptidoglycan/LPS O-acetylase OafA/YrhL
LNECKASHLVNLFAACWLGETVNMKRLDSLDGVRGLLALYVLLSHVAPFAVLPDWIQRALSHGGAAVNVFFILSGLVITQSLLHAGGHAAPFFVARVARIFPVFLAVFAFAVIIEPLSCGFERMPWIGPQGEARSICVSTWPQAWLPEIAAHLTMTHGLFPKLVLPDVWVSFLGSAWSLSTEWQFYLLAMLAAGRSRRLVWILPGLAVAGVAWRWSMPEAWQFSRAFVPNKGHFFALGVASVAVVQGQHRAMVRYMLVLLATLAICTTEGSLGKLLPPLAWTVCLALEMKPSTIGLRGVGALLRGRTARYLGAISYCLYLVNEPLHKVIGEALSRFANGNGALFTALWLPAAIAVPILAAAWLHAYLEAPALRFGRRIARQLSPERIVTTVQARSPAL